MSSASAIDLAAGLSCATGTFALEVGAQTDAERAGARAQATSGAEAFDAGRWQDAVDSFTRAESLTDVQARIPQLKIAVEGAPGDVKVSMDGEPDAPALVGVPQPVNPGQHRIEDVAEGYAGSATITVAERASAGSEPPQRRRALAAPTRCWPRFRGPAKIPFAVTQNISNLNLTKDFLAPPAEKTSRPWLLLGGALAIVTGIGYAAVAFTGSEGAPAPSPAETHAALTAGSDEDLAPSVPKVGGPGPVVAAAAAAAPADESLEEDEGELEQAPTLELGSTTGEFHVRVASYKGAEDAAEYTATLTARGLPATSSLDPETSAWHLVRLGPFASRGEAEKARFQLKLHEREKAYVMPRSNGKYHVQVGSFPTREEAEPVAQRLTARGHVTKISRIKMGAQRWHCVRIGPFDTEQEAADYLSLVELPGSKPVVIPYGPPKL